MSKTLKALFALSLVLLFAAGGAWFALVEAPHQHELERRTNAQGRTYYTCAMHPEVRQEEPGNCPICGMKLVERRQAPSPANDSGRTVLYWYDPMKPEVQFDAPGPSPFMDMDLIPKYAPQDADSASVQMSPAMVQRLAVRSAPVERGTFWQRIDAVAQVQADERRIAKVEARTEGWIESLAVSATGDPVRKGQRLATIYSPALYAAEQELALARASGDASLTQAARERLRLLGGHESGGRGMPVFAPRDGYVTELQVRDGARVAPGAPLMSIADLARVWLIVEVPESQARWISHGRPAEVRLQALPGEVLEAEVEYLYPEVDARTRTLRVRLVIDNPDQHLRPGMFAEATLFGGPTPDVLLIPAEALIRTGRRTAVILDESEGRFRPVSVRTGRERAGRVEILEGLSEGQEVVVSGQFLIDSEANLQGAFRRMADVPPEPGTTPRGQP